MDNQNIKEILDNINNKWEDYYVQDIVSGNELKQLLDYITNLQTIEREYSAILSENAELENKLTNLQKENERLKGDKKKARECINYYAIEDDDFNKLYNVEEQELLAILGDKENE